MAFGVVEVKVLVVMGVVVVAVAAVGVGRTFWLQAFPQLCIASAWRWLRPSDPIIWAWSWQATSQGSGIFHPMSVTAHAPGSRARLSAATSPCDSSTWRLVSWSFGYTTSGCLTWILWTSMAPTVAVLVQLTVAWGASADHAGQHLTSTSGQVLHDHVPDVAAGHSAEGDWPTHSGKGPFGSRVTATLAWVHRPRGPFRQNMSD